MDFTACNECSSKQESYKNGFPKKLLVAVCIVLIVAMCLTPVDARPHHKTRHERNKEERKNKLMPKDERVKTKAMPQHRPKNVPLHTTLARKIIKKLKNTRRYFEDARHEVKDSKEHRFGNPPWLPKMKFSDIHNHTYTDLEYGMSKTKFEFVVPKLYRNLVQFKLVWERLGNVSIKHLDIEFRMNYAKKRESLIRSTLDELFKLLTEIEDDMEKANIPKPHINIDRFNLAALQKDDVETSRCLQQDANAIRAYGNTLKKWYWELRCPDNSNPKLAEQCRRVDQTLFAKRRPLRNAPLRSKERHRRQRRHRHLRSNLGTVTP